MTDNTAVQEFETELLEQLTKAGVIVSNSTEDEVKGAIDFIAIIMMILQMLMQGCNKTPEAAARITSRLGGFVRGYILKAVYTSKDLEPIKDKAYTAIIKTIQVIPEPTLAQAFSQEEDERVDIDWSNF